VGSGRAAAAKGHLVHFGIKISASDESSFSAVHEIIASAYIKSKRLDRKKLQNKGRFLWVRIIHVVGVYGHEVKRTEY